MPDVYFMLLFDKMFYIKNLSLSLTTKICKIEILSPVNYDIQIYSAKGDLINMILSFNNEIFSRT